MARAAEPPEPGADAIPAEVVLGKEEPGGEESEPSNRDHVAHQPRAVETRPGLTKGERLFLAGLVVLAVAGGALYLFRSQIAAQYELRFEPVRYWKAELGRRQFGVKMGVVDLEMCHVDLLAASMKEPTRVAYWKLFGIDENSALKQAREETTAQQGVCKVFADVLDRERKGLAEAERRYDEAEEDRRIAAGLIPRYSPSFVAAWQSATPTWTEIAASPRFQPLSESDKESVRLSYWRDVISPEVPTSELRRARKQFDSLTTAGRAY